MSIHIYHGRIDPDRCRASVAWGGRSMRFSQCLRKPVEGSEFCKQHGGGANAAAITVYITSARHGYEISAEKAISASEKTVLLANGRRTTRRNDWYWYFDTEREAMDAMVKRAKAHIAASEKTIADAQEAIAKYSGGA